MEERAMTGEEVLQEILGALNGNGMQQAANGVYELCAYVDSMTKKVEDMTDEISALRETDVEEISPITLCESDFRTTEDIPTVDDMIALEGIIIFED